MKLEEFEALYKSTKPGWGHCLDRDDVAKKMMPKMIKALKAADYLAQKANPITAAHRHGVEVINESILDDLCNAQVAFEEALAELEETA